MQKQLSLLMESNEHRSYEQTEYHTIMSFDMCMTDRPEQTKKEDTTIRLNFSNHAKSLQTTFTSQLDPTTFTSQLDPNRKSQQKREVIPQDSLIDQFQDFIKNIPPQLRESIQGICINNQTPLHKSLKMQITPSVLQQKSKYLAKTNWLSEFQLQCTIHYVNKPIQTICRIRNSELQFQNSGCTFVISQITKIKVSYESYQRCVWFTYMDNKNSKQIQIKFKIYVENDVKDDIYLLFAKVVVEKLTLMGYDIDMQAGEDLECDKFMIEGKIYKMGQILGQWKQRRVVITDRIESYKGDKNKMTFEMKNIRQIWTRFDVYDQHLVIKIRHGIQKTQLALPMMNYSVRFGKNNWLYRVYRLVSATFN